MWLQTPKKKQLAKQRIQDRDIEVDEENICQVEDKDILKEIEENEKRADKEKARAPAKPKKITGKKKEAKASGLFFSGKFP